MDLLMVTQYFDMIKEGAYVQTHTVCERDVVSLASCLYANLFSSVFLCP